MEAISTTRYYVAVEQSILWETICWKPTMKTKLNARCFRHLIVNLEHIWTLAIFTSIPSRKEAEVIGHHVIAKLEAYGFDKISLYLLRDYTSNRKQRTKLASSFSNGWDVICGIPQGSIPGPLLFNILIKNMLFLFTKSDICNFADDSTLSSCEKILGDMMPNLKFDFGHILKLF